MSQLSIIRAIDKCNGSVSRAVSTISQIDNEDFVAFVRETRTAEPLWWTDPQWNDAVNLEIKMRLLLNGAGGGGGNVVLD